MSTDTRISELEAQVASLKTQLEEQQQMLAALVLPPELLRASSKGMTAMVEKLLAAGAKPETRDEVKGVRHTQGHGCLRPANTREILAGE
jgi:uncharacterized coiled-coil protein SlyX